jgi:hypothetical protein|tara:strand:+ start:54050 stop:54277 length:228 start_codon:yes stop_codon:yes gene_type:complete
MSKEDEKKGLPQSLLDKIYDSTGSANGGNRGFLLLYVDKEGCPSMTTRTENPCVEMALGKLIELAMAKKDSDITL